MTTKIRAKAKRRTMEGMNNGACELHRLVDIDTCRTQKDDLLCLETRALLKILALGQQDVDAGRVKPVADVVMRLRAKRTEFRSME